MPAELTVVVDKVQEIGSGHITVTQGDSAVVWSRPFWYDTYDGTLTTPYLYAGRPRVMLDIDNIGLAKETTLTDVRDISTGIHGILDSRLTKCDTDHTVVTSGDVKVTNLHGEFAQYNNESVASGSTNTYGPFTIDWAERKTVGVWVNTGDVSVKILVSNDGSTFYDYYSKDVTSGSSATMSFTESFASMRVEVLGSTDAGYNLLVSRQV